MQFQPGRSPCRKSQSDLELFSARNSRSVEVVATPEALRIIEEAGQSPDFFLDMHVQGNWGDVDSFDSRANDEALTSGDRILSVYRTLKNVKIWIITEAEGDNGQREATTILRPEQY